MGRLVGDATDEAMLVELLLCGNGGFDVKTVVLAVGEDAGWDTKAFCEVVNCVSDTELAMEPIAIADTLVDEAVVARACCCITAAAVTAIWEPASWLRLFTIIRPFGPILGLIFLADAKGGVRVMEERTTGPGGTYGIRLLSKREIGSQVEVNALFI